MLLRPAQAPNPSRVQPATTRRPGQKSRNSSLTGGKIIVQAKRYRGTVGVSAVRELYGTMITEGAGKGILVTTSHCGIGSHEFVEDKPLTLIEGPQLVHYLQNHGHRVRINLREVREDLLGDDDAMPRPG